MSQIFFLPWYLLFPWYFLLFALKDRVLIIVKWCTASSAHWGLPGWGGWEGLEGEGGKVRERWKVKGKRFNPPLSLKYFFLPLPPSCKDWEKSPWLWKRASNNWLLARGMVEEKFNVPLLKGFYLPWISDLREGQRRAGKYPVGITHPTTDPANLGLNFVAIIKNFRPNEESCL